MVKDRAQPWENERIAMAANILDRWRPGQPRVARAEVARASIGGLVGVLVAGGVGTLWMGAPDGAILLIAPIGASAVLLFAVPASPFAQPYALLAGNLLAASIGVTAAHWIAWPLPAAGIAVAGAIAAMSLCRCLHPPSGAVALVAVVGGPHVLAAGYGFVLVPVLLNSLLLAAAALAFNNLTGRSYPHRAHAVAHPNPPPAPPRLSRHDFEAAIAGYGETLAIGADDLQKLFEDLVGRAAPHSPSDRG